MVWKPPPPLLCTVCTKKVFPVEELTVDGAVYHKKCFRCHTCSRVLTLGDFASHRLPEDRGLALFCKPHFRQNFMDSGGRYTVAEASTSKEAAPAPAPAYKPSCVTLFSDDEADHTPAASLVVRKTPQKPAASFDSGFEPEYKLGEAKPLQTKGCAKCGAKVFPICKLELPDGSGIYHVDCFRCSVCSVHLRVGSYEASEDGSLRCMKHILTAKKA